MKKTLLFVIVAVFAITGCKKKKEEEAPKKEAPKKVAPKKVAPKKVAPKKVAPKKVAPKKVEPKKVEAGFKKIPNINGFVADVPAHAVPNGIGGAAGYHSKDNSFEFQLREVKGKELKTTFKKAKKNVKMLFFKKMVKAEKTKDGWLLIWHMKNPNAKNAKKVPVIFSFEVVRKIDGKVFKCYGGVEKEKGVGDCVKACNSIKKG